MNRVLQEILRSRTVTDGREVLELHSEMGEAEGKVITRVFESVKPDTSIEVGLAYGISALYACEALAANGKPSRYLVIDPDQSGVWRGIGLEHLRRADYGRFVDFHEEKSEMALPRLLANGTRIQAAIIDGWHTFDHALVDFFFVNKMLEPQGIVILDDTDWPAIRRLSDHILTYPAYELFMTSGGEEISASGATTDGGNPRCMAFRKLAPDDRPWDWHVEF